MGILSSRNKLAFKDMKRSESGWTVREIIETFFENGINPAAWLGSQICDSACVRASRHRADYKQAQLTPSTGVWLLLLSQPRCRVLPVIAHTSDWKYVKVVETIQRFERNVKIEKTYEGVVALEHLVSRNGPKEAFKDTPLSSQIGSQEEIEAALLGKKVHNICRAWLNRPKVHVVECDLRDSSEDEDFRI